MKKTIASSILNLAKQDREVYLLTGDIGFHVFDDFQNAFPNHFINVGIAEASMIGMAAGLAMQGKCVFVYSLASFLTMRCFEQIRVDLCYQKIPVIMLGIGGGLSYGPAGATHQTIEDVAIMNALPNMSVICPGDPIELKHAIETATKLNGPCYIRLGRNKAGIIHSEDTNIDITKNITVRKGHKVVLVSTGTMLETATCVSDVLKQNGIEIEVVSLPFVKPIDEVGIVNLAKKFNCIVTLEEHSKIGGLGSIVSNIISDFFLKTKLIKLALPDSYIKVVGDNDFLRSYYNLSVDSIVKIIEKEYIEK